MVSLPVCRAGPGAEHALSRTVPAAGNPRDTHHVTRFDQPDLPLAPGTLPRLESAGRQCHRLRLRNTGISTIAKAATKAPNPKVAPGPTRSHSMPAVTLASSVTSPLSM